jgi:hypothetical protein
MATQPRLLFLIRAGNTGGTYHAFNQVRALNRMGFSAAAVYVGQEKVEPKSEPDLPILKGLGSLDLQPRDIVVIDEGFREAFTKLARVPVRKVLFNQAIFYGWYFGLETPEELNAYPTDAVITASGYATDFLRRFGVAKPIHTVFPKLDEAYRPAKKELKIAYNAGKRRLESRFVKTYFGARHPEWRNVPWVPLIEMTREQCATAMGASFIYASFAHLESLGLMSLEAMKSDCLVVGYTGGGGKEYATAENGRWIEESDYDGFADALADLCAAFNDPDRCRDQIAAGRKAAGHFDEGHFLSSLTDCWNGILGADAALYRRSRG